MPFPFVMAGGILLLPVTMHAAKTTTTARDAQGDWTPSPRLKCVKPSLRQLKIAQIQSAIVCSLFDQWLIAIDYERDAQILLVSAER
jgi:hypothetical protein